MTRRRRRDHPPGCRYCDLRRAVRAQDGGDVGALDSAVAAGLADRAVINGGDIAPVGMMLRVGFDTDSHRHDGRNSGCGLSLDRRCVHLGLADLMSPCTTSPMIVSRSAVAASSEDSSTGLSRNGTALSNRSSGLVSMS